MTESTFSKTAQDQLTRIPDNYTKELGSNIHKVLEIDGKGQDTLRTVITTVCAWRSLKDAEGLTLDRIGVELGVQRGRFTDIEYRRRLIAKTATLLSSGEIDRINEVLGALMGNGFLGIQEGWTDVAVWDYHFDGNTSFNGEIQVFDGGDPCPLGPPEPATIIIRCDLDTLYADIQEIFEKYGIFYNVTDILASIRDIQNVMQNVTAAGIGVHWFPIISAVGDGLELENTGKLIITIENIRHYFFNGVRYFNGLSRFNGGYSPFNLINEETVNINQQVTTGPVNRFNGCARFNGWEEFNADREIGAHHPVFIIEIPGDTSVIPAQTGLTTVVLEPKRFFFNGVLQFDGEHRFNGFISVEPKNNSNETLNHKMETSPVTRFDMLVPFTGNLQFNGVREVVLHEVVITEVSA